MNPPAITSIDLIYPRLPPAPDGIGDYTAYLAEELAKLVQVRILTSSEHHASPIHGVEIVPCFTLNGTGRFRELTRELARSSSQATVLQYNPFSWGKRGWAPGLCTLWKDNIRSSPRRIWATTFHETYILNSGWRAAVMRIYQRRQYAALSDVSQVNFYATEAWMASKFVSSANRSKSVSLPVGASMQAANSELNKKRERLGIPQNAFVIGTFGSAHVSKNLDWVQLAVERLKSLTEDRPLVFLHVGDRMDAWRDLKVKRIETGRLPADEASYHLACMDLMLSPFLDGLTTRRSSVMAALINGVPVLSTQSCNTDSILIDKEDYGIFLSTMNKDDWLNKLKIATSAVIMRRDSIRHRLASYYESNFSWRTIARKKIDVLTQYCARNFAS